jgi:hypothetical protein
MGVSNCWIVLLLLAYLAVSSVFAFMRLLPMSAAGKDLGILTLRHQLAVLQLADRASRRILDTHGC